MAGLIFSSKFIFLFFHWNWVLTGLTTTCLETTFATLPCGCVWPPDFVLAWSIRGDNMHVFHITCLKENCLPNIASFPFMWLTTQTWWWQCSRCRAAGRKETRSLHHFRQLPSQPWLLHYIFKSEANKLLLSLNLFWKLHTRNPIQYNM